MSVRIVEVQNLSCEFAAGRGRDGRRQKLKAVDNVSFDVGREETLGLVGESGSGKSTIGRLLVGLLKASSGEIRLFGQSATGPGDAKALARVRKRIQFIFQDPHAALNPRMRIGDAIAEPLDIAGGWSKRDRADRIGELLEMVGLSHSFAMRFPHEFSGGQRQRIVIARALALNPEFVVCDEPVASLDVSMQAQIVNLLKDLQERLGLSYLFIAHDLAVVRSVSHRVAVLYAGRIVEISERRSLYQDPRHPYTQALLDAVPRPQVGRRPPPIKGEIISLIDRPEGCSLCPRCPSAMEICRRVDPALREIAPGKHVACHLYS
ncbi:ABC transporter ATP-binding protein [Saliniramus fredricksonii]|uniref:Peptide/nickel transport system ATP-binding protein n=1 Tax=Saliniramus fredricksonii TaxID=1653334 RepID=A0ABY0K9M3_9HYPH|nr:peptide/nickel transport system ATP-binding protein [Saliniramus fredricksonii]